MIGALAGEVILALTRPEGISTRNVFEATVEGVMGRGPICEVTLRAADPWTAHLTCNAVRDLALQPGRRVWCLLKTFAFHWLDGTAESGPRNAE